MFTTLVRTVILYLIIIAGIRLMGKRQVGELEPSELVFALIIADLAAVPMQDFGIPLLSGVIPILTLLCINLIMSILSLKSLRFRSLMCGRPSIIVRDGVLVEREMAKNRFTIDELMEELRLKGYTDLTAIKYAILETSGQLSVLPYAAQQPVTAAQMGRTPNDPGLPLVLINDGRLIAANFTLLGLDAKWLEGQLHSRKLKDPSQVFLLTVDEQGNVYLVKKEAVH